MYKVMYLDDLNRDGDELAGYFDSEESLIEALEKYGDNNRNCEYCGTETYAGKKCYVVASKHSRKVYKSRYYLEKIQNGWV